MSGGKRQNEPIGETKLKLQQVLFLVCCPIATPHGDFPSLTRAEAFTVLSSRWHTHSRTAISGSSVLADCCFVQWTHHTDVSEMLPLRRVSGCFPGSSNRIYSIISDFLNLGSDFLSLMPAAVWVPSHNGWLFEAHFATPHEREDKAFVCLTIHLTSWMLFSLCFSSVSLRRPIKVVSLRVGTVTTKFTVSPIPSCTYTLKPLLSSFSSSANYLVLLSELISDRDAVSSSQTDH